MAFSLDFYNTYQILGAALSGDLKLLKTLASQFDMGDGLEQTIASQKDFNGRTALHFAAIGGRTHVCKFLMEEAKLDANARDGKGETPLHYAISEDRHQTAVYLLESDANPNAATDKGLTPLHYAAQTGLKKLLRLLISKGAKVDAKAYFGTPLQWAASHGKKEAVKILLDNHADPNMAFDLVHCPFVASILARSFECVKLLLQAGADPNAQSLGMTPLEVAASEGETEIIKCLLNAGADPNDTSNVGLTPVEIAALQGHQEDVRILLPVTSPIPSVTDWCFNGIMNYVNSETFERQMKRRREEHFSLSKSKGDHAFMRNDYSNAIYWYSEAINTESTILSNQRFVLEAAILSNRSLSWAYLNEGHRALADAKICLMLHPLWPKAHYTLGVAWSILKDFEEAADSFLSGMQLDRKNSQLDPFLWDSIGIQQLHLD